MLVRKVCVPMMIAGLVAVSACGGDSNPASPSSNPLPNPTLSAPAPQTPGDGDQLDTLRPILTVNNGTSDQAGTRTYDFQIADNESFSTNVGSFITSYAVVLEKTGVAEGTGTTTFTPDQDLQPTTPFNGGYSTGPLTTWTRGTSQTPQSGSRRCFF
ncbi:MAG: hypothetical protein ACRD1Q_08455 [Vicinamibacterales bacterium]